MALAKVGRKIKRTGKAAVQFKFTATFEYIDLECTGSWRPEDVKVVWQRSHRKIESNAVKWRVVADRGPEGATGRGLFDPPIAVALIITLYREAKSTEFEEKEYKFYIENQGVAGKKILASFHCNMADYAGIPNTRSALELDCKPVSKKIRKAHLGVTLESEYIKEGASNDSDMQSTYSHMTAMGEDHSVREDVSDDEGDSSPPVASKIPTTTNGNLSSEKSPPVNGKVSNSNGTSQSTLGAHSEAEEGKTLLLSSGVVKGSESEVNSEESHVSQIQPSENSHTSVHKGDKITGNAASEKEDISVQKGQEVMLDQEERKLNESELQKITEEHSPAAGGSPSQDRKPKEPVEGSMVVVDSILVETTPRMPEFIVKTTPTEESNVMAAGESVKTDSNTTIQNNNTSNMHLLSEGEQKLAKSKESERLARENDHLPAVGNSPVQDGKFDVRVQDSVVVVNSTQSGTTPIVPHPRDCDPPVHESSTVIQNGEVTEAWKSNDKSKHEQSLDSGRKGELSVVNNTVDLEEKMLEQMPNGSEVQGSPTGPSPPLLLSPSNQSTPSLPGSGTVDHLQSLGSQTPPPLSEVNRDQLQVHNGQPRLPPTDKENTHTQSSSNPTSHQVRSDLEKKVPSEADNHSPLNTRKEPPGQEELRTLTNTAVGGSDSIEENIGKSKSLSQKKESLTNLSLEPSSKEAVEEVFETTIPSDRPTQQNGAQDTTRGDTQTTGDNTTHRTAQDQSSSQGKPSSDTLTAQMTAVASLLSSPATGQSEPQVLDKPPKKPPRSPRASLKWKVTDQATSEKSKEKHSKQGTPDSQDMMESVNVEVLSKWLPPSTQLVDAKNQPVPMETLYRAKVFGLYFTAMWCPPCRKFIPKLVKFNDILKENNARFSVMYVSSDHTEEDMLEHLQSNSVSFPAVKFTDPTAEKLREKFGIRQVPHLMIIDSSGKIIDDGARKVVEVATSTAAAMNCYGKWLQGEPAPREKKGPRVGLFSRSGGKKSEPIDEKLKSPKEGPSEPPSTDSHPSVVTSLINTSSNRIRVESQMKSSVDAARESNLLAELEKKDGIIKDLEVRNEALEQRVKDLSEENIKLKDTIEEQQKKLEEIKTAQTTLLEEKENIVAKASIRGFLLKRGVRGPTGRLWRRRYFRTDQTGRLCYYKFAEDSSPQGFIDLQSVVDVRVSPAGRQDKTECTFEVIVEGRTYELLAMDKTEMDKWIDAIKYLSQWHRKNVGTFRDSPAANS